MMVLAHIGYLGDCIKIPCVMVLAHILYVLLYIHISLCYVLPKDLLET